MQEPPCRGEASGPSKAVGSHLEGPRGAQLCERRVEADCGLIQPLTPHKGAKLAKLGPRLVLRRVLNSLAVLAGMILMPVLCGFCTGSAHPRN